MLILIKVTFFLFSTSLFFYKQTFIKIEQTSTKCAKLFQNHHTVDRIHINDHH